MNQQISTEVNKLGLVQKKTSASNPPHKQFLRKNGCAKFNYKT